MTLRARIRVWLTATGVPLVVAEMEPPKKRDEPKPREPEPPPEKPPERGT